MDFALLLGVLASFAVLDAAALRRIGRIEVGAAADLPASRAQLDRLARVLLTSAAALAVAFAAVFAALLLRG